MATIVTDVRKKDYGIQITVTVKDKNTGLARDISTASTKLFRFRRPDKTWFEVTASFTGTGVDGKLKYVTTSTDLDVSGEWKLQVWLTFPGALWHSTWASIRIGENIEDVAP